MTSGGLTCAEAWNLQLQAKVDRLATDLATAEQIIRDLTRDMQNSTELRIALKFLDELEEKRRLAAACAADVEALINEAESLTQGASDGK
jgi:hypothetical protein